MPTTLCAPAGSAVTFTSLHAATLLPSAPPTHPSTRPADTQGDISQARGQLGQLLFEFSQIELNRDLLDAIKRTESKTGAWVAAAHSIQHAWAGRSARAACCLLPACTGAGWRRGQGGCQAAGGAQGTNPGGRCVRSCSCQGAECPAELKHAACLPACLPAYLPTCCGVQVALAAGRRCRTAAWTAPPSRWLWQTRRSCCRRSSSEAGGALRRAGEGGAAAWLDKSRSWGLDSGGFLCGALYICGLGCNSRCLVCTLLLQLCGGALRRCSAAGCHPADVRCASDCSFR